MQQEFAKDTYCSHCGTAFPADAPWPHRCLHCGNATYRNPLPVSVVLLPIDDGLLAPPQSSQDMPAFVPSRETSEMRVAQGPLDLAFLTHTEVAARYWKETFEDGKTDTR